MTRNELLNFGQVGGLSSLEDRLPANLNAVDDLDFVDARDEAQRLRSVQEYVSVPATKYKLSKIKIKQRRIFLRQHPYS